MDEATDHSTAAALPSVSTTTTLPARLSTGPMQPGAAMRPSARSSGHDTQACEHLKFCVATQAWLPVNTVIVD